MPSGLNVVLALRPCEFDYKQGGHDVSFIAQEYQQVLPDQVTASEPSEAQKEWVGNDQVLGLQKNLDPYFVKAIQEQQAIITALTARVEALEGAQA